MKFKQYNFNDVVENKKSAEIADVLIGCDTIVVINGFVSKGYIKPHKKGFVYDVYDINAEWNEDRSEFDNKFFRDGGICIFGDNLDATVNFIEMLKEQENHY